MTVFCKHCGKQITDDSLYCQHCGGKQDMEPSRLRKGMDKNNPVELSKILLLLQSEKSKKYLLAFIIWVVLHLILLCFGDERYTAQMWFYPFTNKGFELKYYDTTEFITYVVLIPLLLLFYCKYLHEPLMIKIKEWKKNK